jgi:hypothetical protein
MYCFRYVTKVNVCVKTFTFASTNYFTNPKITFIMKKMILLACVAFSMASCVTTVKTARVADTKGQLLNATVADLEVSPTRVTYSLEPSREIQRAGLSNVKQAAIQECLLKNGNADVLVDAEYTIEQQNNWIFGKKINKITVSGHPAKFKNYHGLNDSVWCNPAFRAGYGNAIGRPSSGGLFKK